MMSEANHPLEDDENSIWLLSELASTSQNQFFMFMALTIMIKFSGPTNTLARNGWILYADAYLLELKFALWPVRPPTAGRD